MIQYLIGAGLGYLVSELVRSGKSEKKEESANGFFVFLRADDLGKATLSFYDYKSVFIYRKTINFIKLILCVFIVANRNALLFLLRYASWLRKQLIL